MRDFEDKNRKPIVGVLGNFVGDDNFRRFSVGERYMSAVQDCADAVPVMIPGLGAEYDVDAVLAMLDGVVLTGGITNVEPYHYDGGPSRTPDLHDRRRDTVALALARKAVARAVPLFGICRGIQEMNVAFGGSLHQVLHAVPGRLDHRRERHLAMPEGLRARQQLALTPGGYLARLLGETHAVVNSLHGQGIDRLADGFDVEAVAEDGTIEAIDVRDAASFAVGVQWHVEWGAAEHPLYRVLFEAFGDACRARARRRHAMLADAAD